MGCGGSKVDSLPLVIRCRERKKLIKAAVDQRYAFSTAHILYLRALIDVGEALRRFVDEEIVVGESPFDSPVFTLPFDEGKRGKSRNVGGTSRSVGGDDDEGGHLHLSDSELDSYDGHIRFNDGHIHIDDDDDEDGGHIHIDDDEDGGGGGHIHIDDDDDDDDGGGHIHIDDDSPDNRGKRVTPARQRAIEQDGYGVNRYPRREPDGYGVDRYPRREPDGYGVDRYPRREPDGYGGDRYPQWGPNGYEANFNPPPQSGWQPYGYGTDQPYGMNAVDEPYAMNVVDQPYGTGWGQYGGNSNTYAYYMKSSGPSVRTVIHGQGPYAHADSYTGYPDASPRAERPTPPPPSPPSVWDYLDNVLETFNPDIYAQSAQGYSSIASSPDSDEVRVREGIPDLEEETETEIINEVHEQNNVNDNVKRTKPMPPKKGEGSRDVRSHDSEDSPRTGPSHSSDASRAIPLHNDRGKKPMISYNDGGKMAMPSVQSEGTSRAGPSPSQNSKAKSSTSAKGEEGSPDTVVTMSSENDYVQKRGVSFEAEEVSLHDVESSKTSSLTTSSTHGSRDIQEVVSEIKSEFEIASSHGKEVALMLEVGKLPYLPKSTALKVALSRIMHRKAPSSASSVARPSARVDSKTIKLARSYYGNSEKDTNVEYGNKASVLEEIYVWEKRLYKEVKVEERLRLIYEKLSKKLKALDDKGAESSKIDATRASIRRLLTKLNVCMRGIEAISSRIHKLRDEELQPRITKLIHGLTRMWKLMLKCHRKQFQAIMDSKTRKLRSNTGFQKDSRLRATIELEMELRSWCSYFNDWITAQKSYVKSLNGWLFRCLDHEPEVTSDGIVPFSPGRIGAPLIFVTCHDWHQAMGVMKEDGVANSMQHFASNLRNLWERQDEEQRHRLKAEYLAKDYDKRMKGLRGERENPGRNQEAMSRKTVVASESGISRRDDLKVDLDSMRKRLEEERIRHSDAMKLVHDAASSSLQGGLVPIFKALENFSSVALTAHEQVRLQILEEGQ